MGDVIELVEFLKDTLGPVYEHVYAAAYQEAVVGNLLAWGAGAVFGILAIMFYWHGRKDPDYYVGAVFFGVIGVGVMTVVVHDYYAREWVVLKSMIKLVKALQ